MSTPNKVTATSVPMGNHSAPQKTNCQAVASMVCGIIGLFCFGVILGSIAICLGVSAKKAIKENPEQETGECQATAGIVMGSISVVLWIIVIIVYINNSN